MDVELHCRTNYSFLVGASHPDELVERAVELGYTALAITDEASVAGVVRAFAAARRTSLKLITGTELTLSDGARLVLWARDRKGYGQLCRLLTLGRTRTDKGSYRLDWTDLAAHSAGLLAGVVLSERRVTRGVVTAREGLGNDRLTPIESNAQTMALCRDLFGDRAYLLAEPALSGDDEIWFERLANWSRRWRLPLAAAGDVLYHVPDRQALQRTLVAIRERTVVDLVHEEIPNAGRHLRSLEDRQRLFQRYPEALRRASEIADRCVFALDELRYEYPEEMAPEGRSPMEYLRELAWRGARRRYPSGVPVKVQELLERELGLIEELHYEAYFLTVWDAVRFARERGILCQGRGSAANSAVCFCLGVTAVDPDTTDVLFERFISRERDEAPDIDVDFEHERREEVLQYLYQKYGRDRAGLAATVITYRPRSAVRDLGKALGFAPDVVDAVAKQVDHGEDLERIPERMQATGVDPESRRGAWWLRLTRELLGFPRHLSQHVGGMVMTRGPLCELVPIENAAMPGRTVIQWDKDDLEELGILKVDCLSLGMLSAIRRAFDLVREFHGQTLSIASIPQGDAQVYDMICRADTVGVFQIESRAQMSMLPRLKPRCYYDLVIEVAIVRPGPIQGQMVHPYLRRRAGEEAVSYPNEEIAAVLHKTLGVPIFQEQAMRLAVVAAGFTPGEADQLRRAMGAWRRTGVIEKFRVKLLEGMRHRGLSEEFAEQVFRQLRGFGEYGFPESHAASFALLVYVSAWLKFHHAAAFTAALINSQPMGFYAPAQLLDDAKRHGVELRPIDVNFSDWDCTLEPRDADESFLAGFVHHRDCRRPPMFQETTTVSRGGRYRLPGSEHQHDDHFSDAAACARVGEQKAARNQTTPSPALRLGMRLIEGLSLDHVLVVLEARRRGPFRSMAEFARRTGLGRAALARFAEADAFRSLADDRRQALWESLAQERQRTDQPLLAGCDPDEESTELPETTEQWQVHEDYRTTGCSLRSHPMAFHRDALRDLGILAAAALKETPDGQRVRVGGLVILRQRPATAKGITFCTLEDETGTVNLVVRPDVWERFRDITRGASAWIARGKLERRLEVIHVVVDQVEDLAYRLQGLRARSRDFR